MGKLLFCSILIFLLTVLFPTKALASWVSHKGSSSRQGNVPYGVADLTPIRWTSQNIKTINSPPVVGVSGDVYVGGSSYITKLDKNGNKLWSYPFGLGPSNGLALDSSENVYFSSSGSNPYVFALNKNGTLIWSYDLRQGGGQSGYSQSRAPVTLSSDEKILYVGANYPPLTQKIFAFNTNNGTIKWKSAIQTGEEPNFSSVTLDGSGNLYFGTSQGGLLFSKDSNGAKRWVRNFSSATQARTPVFGPDGNIYVCSYNNPGGDVLASVTSNGALRWTYKVANTVINPEPVIKDSVVYLAETTHIRAINTSDGTQNWIWSAPNNQGVNTPVVDKNGIIYTSANDQIFAINPDGSQKASLTLDGGLGPPIISEDGLIYLFRNPPGTSEGYLYAIGTAPKVVLPVVFIPGIGGSEFKASQDIFYSGDNGHGGTYSHAYATNEKIWVNQDEAIKFGDDDYFDVLKLKSDALTPEAPGLTLSGELTPFGYGDINGFFTELGYSKNSSFFIFPYDWRKDVRSAKGDLDALIETAKQNSGQTQVNLVAHSMGGLIARDYISEASKAAKVNKLIEIGVPHLGAPHSIKTLQNGSWLGRDLYLFKLGVGPSEVKDVLQNLSSAFVLSPSLKYFDFYNNLNSVSLYPFKDDRDVDNNKITGPLDYSQTKTLLGNLGHNMTAFGLGEQYHDTLDPLLTQTNGVKLYEIVGTGQPTLGQIRETWWVTWPINFIPRREEIFINGDDTIPLYSASLKSDSLDLSAGATIHYVEQRHSDLASKTGPAMNFVRSILNEDNSVQVQTQKFYLEGQEVSIDDADIDLYDEENLHTGLDTNGNIETNIADTFYDSIDSKKYVFIKKKAKKVTVKIKPSKKTSKKSTVKIRSYKSDKITQTATYNEIPTDSVDEFKFNLDPSSDTPINISVGANQITPTVVTGDESTDQTSPTTTSAISGTQNSTGSYKDSVIITLASTDASGSGILKTEYSLDSGVTVQIYTDPITISTPGSFTLQYRSIDQVNNQEVPETVTFTVVSSTSTSSSTTSNSSSSSGSSTSSSDTSSNQTTSEANSQLQSLIDSPFNILTTKEEKNLGDVLGISTINPPKFESAKSNDSPAHPATTVFFGSLVILGDLITSALGLLASVDAGMIAQELKEAKEIKEDIT